MVINFHRFHSAQISQQLWVLAVSLDFWCALLLEVKTPESRDGQCLPSSLDSLAQGWRALGMCEVLGSYAGILAPDHDGFFPVFATAGRAAFDEAEPMATQVVEITQVDGSRIERSEKAFITRTQGIPLSRWSLSHL